MLLLTQKRVLIAKNLHNDSNLIDTSEILFAT